MQPDRFQYNPFYFEDLCDILQRDIRGFDRSQFILRIFNNAWPDLDFAERSRHIALVLRHFLGVDFNASMKVLHRLLEFSERRKNEAFPSAFVLDYVLLYGTSDINTGLATIETITNYIDPTNVLRQLVISHPENTYRKMLEWSLSSNDRLRKLSYTILANKNKVAATEAVVC